MRDEILNTQKNLRTGKVSLFILHHFQPASFLRIRTRNKFPLDTRQVGHYKLHSSAKRITVQRAGTIACHDRGNCENRENFIIMKKRNVDGLVCL